MAVETNARICVQLQIQINWNPYSDATHLNLCVLRHV